LNAKIDFWIRNSEFEIGSLNLVPPDESGSPSLCLLALGEARESESPAGATPGLLPGQAHIQTSPTSPAGAKPDLPRRCAPRNDDAIVKIFSLHFYTKDLA